MVPLAIYEAVRIPLFLAYVPSMSITVSPDLFTLYKSSPFAFSSGSAALAGMVTYNQVFYFVAVVNAILHVLAYLTCAWFWIPAVRNTCVVEYRHAVVIVLVPLLVFLALSFGSGLISGHFNVCGGELLISRIFFAPLRKLANDSDYTYFHCRQWRPNVHGYGERSDEPQHVPAKRFVREPGNCLVPCLTAFFLKISGYIVRLLPDVLSCQGLTTADTPALTGLKPMSSRWNIHLENALVLRD